MGRKLLKSFKVYFVSPEKWFCIRWPNLAFSSLVPIINGLEDSIKAFDRLENKYIENSDMERKFLERFKHFLSFPEEWFCIHRPNLLFLTFYQYSVTQKIRAWLLVGFNFEEVLHLWASYQYSGTKNIPLGYSKIPKHVYR